MHNLFDFFLNMLISINRNKFYYHSNEFYYLPNDREISINIVLKELEKN